MKKLYYVIDKEAGTIKAVCYDLKSVKHYIKMYFPQGIIAKEL